MSALARYATVLRPPGATAALTASVVGRLSLGMTGLAALLLVKDTTGSYAVAGAVSAAYALAFAVAAPGRARSADRGGPRRVLVQCGVLHPLGLVALVVLCSVDAAVPTLLLAAVAAGATVPPHGAVMRALWGTLVHGPAIATAYALEAVVVELCFVLGPLLVAIGIALEGPSTALLLSAALGSVGALWLAALAVVRTVEPHPDRASSSYGPLASPVVRALLLTVFWIGLGFGSVEVAVTAFVEEEGRSTGVTGVVLAVWSLGSMAGGLVYGALHPTTRPARQLPVLVAALALASLLPVLTGTVLLLSVALFVYGTTIAPFSACNSVLLGAAAPAGTVTEAFAWNGSMIFAGAAVGSALGGVLAEQSGSGAAFALTAIGGLGAVGSSVLGLRALRAG